MSSAPTEDLQSDALTRALFEPVSGVFQTRHSTEANRIIAHRGLILLSEIGSTVHGTNVDANNDIDEMGICIEDPITVIGNSTFEQYEYRTQAVNVRSGTGDIDRTIYGLRKWAKLAASGNPTVITPLFTDYDQHVRHMDPIFGASLRASKGLFLTKRSGEAFLSFLQDQRDRYLDPERTDSKHASRPELVEKYGWDTKTGYHVLRLAIQGTELMNQGAIILPMASYNRAFLLKVRNGEYSREQVTDLLDSEYIPMLKRAIEKSSLPDEPDHNEINSWLTRMYRVFWETKGL